MNAIVTKSSANEWRLQTAVLVLADVQKPYEPNVDPAFHAAVENCQLALSFARRAGIPVAFVRRQYPWLTTCQPWLAGFMPSRSEMVFERSHHSCYASDAFAQMADVAGALAFAGFFSESTAVATTMDALRRGGRVTFLRDASWSDTYSSPSPDEIHRAATTVISTIGEICTTDAWISAMRLEQR